MMCEDGVKMVNKVPLDVELKFIKTRLQTLEETLWPGSSCPVHPIRNLLDRISDLERAFQHQEDESVYAIDPTSDQHVLYELLRELQQRVAKLEHPLPAMEDLYTKLAVTDRRLESVEALLDRCWEKIQGSAESQTMILGQHTWVNGLYLCYTTEIAGETLSFATPEDAQRVRELLASVSHVNDTLVATLDERAHETQALRDRVDELAAILAAREDTLKAQARTLECIKEAL